MMGLIEEKILSALKEYSKGKIVPEKLPNERASIYLINNKKVWIRGSSSISVSKKDAEYFLFAFVTEKSVNDLENGAVWCFGKFEDAEKCNSPKKCGDKLKNIN